MAVIVVCGDLEHEIEKTGELNKLQSLGVVEIINELDPTGEFLIRRLRGARAVLEFADEPLSMKGSYINCPTWR